MNPNDQSALQRAAPQLAPYVRTPQIGDYAPDLNVLDDSGRALRLFEDAFAGRPIVLVVCNRLDEDSTRAWLAEWAAEEAELERLRAHLIFLTSETSARLARSLRRELGLLAPICSDGNGTMLAQMGIPVCADPSSAPVTRTVIITPHRQICALYDETGQAAARARQTVENLNAESDRMNDAGWIPGHAPILIVPQALDPADCQALIETYEKSDAFRVARPDAQSQGDYKFMVSDYNRTDRVDHVIQDQALLQRLDQRINERILPMVQKAFAFQVTRRETLHIARYRGERGGIEIGHRDNAVPQSAYRRFALSISLNTDYEGGELVFREYAGKGYRGDVGTALVFSSGLLHEIEETTEGTRYNLISHLFNDASAQQAQGMPR